MKKTFVFLLTVLIIQNTSGQSPDAILQDTSRQKVSHIVKLHLKGNSAKAGTLMSTRDTSLILAKTTKWFDPGLTPTEIIPVENILKIHIKKRGLTKSCVSTGIVLGALAGGIIGYSSYKSPKNSQGPSYIPDVTLDFGPGLPALAGIIIGLPAGALLGMIVGGSFEKTILIKGNRNTYAAQREKLKRLSITGQ